MKKMLFILSIASLCLSEIMAATLPLISKPTPRIVGGEISNHNAWPWMAILVMHDQSPLEGQFCGGTLIHPQWVLTAAHCVEDIFSSRSIDVLFGMHNLRTDEGERVPVQKIVIHPNYQNLDSDIALLKLEKPVAYTPVNLINSDMSTEGKMATALGWGNTSALDTRPIFLDELRQVELPIVSNTECSNIHHWFEITPNMLCAGFIEGGKDSCQGDSGGPLVIKNESGDGWNQVGIVSFGDGCAQPGSYGVYTRVSIFNDFLTEQLCELEAPVMTLDVIENNTLVISWSQVANATGYNIYYAPYPFGIPIEHFDIGKETKLLIHLSSGNNFYVAIRAYNDSCQSGFSNSDFFIIP
ncbi:MAG: hypothetical protein DRQ57_10920 [Gammaproteobacteria bacterium]|nr:MAG: hypothetical protein DRQ57_10920 [Gammaproteobacteria bacterium]